MTFILRYWRVLAVVGIAVAALLASYAKGRHDANVVWEAKHKDELIRMYEAGKTATNKALEGWRKDLDEINNRPKPPVVRVCPRLPAATGGTASTAPPGQPPTLGERVEEGRDIGSLTANILDDADRNAARCNALIEWYRVQARKPE